jgi:hypothetical protein
MKIKIGSKVVGAHGKGVVVAYNGTNPINKDLDFKTQVEIANSAGLLCALANSFYDKDRYPFIVQFEDGYKDCYSENELEFVS